MKKENENKTVVIGARGMGKTIEVIKDAISSGIIVTNIAQSVIEINKRAQENLIRFQKEKCELLREYYHHKYFKYWNIPFDELDAENLKLLENTSDFAVFRLNVVFRQLPVCLRSDYPYDTDKIYEESKRKALKKCPLEAKNVRRYLRKRG